jgi:NTP pyrophosphatase (non-canonical NTP hydrolase)
VERPSETPRHRRSAAKEKRVTGHDDRSDDREDWGLRAFQRTIDETYGERDRARGVPGAFLWFSEEVGELARCLSRPEPGSPEEAREFADVLAWLSTLASMRGIDLAAAAREKYATGCPRCHATPCSCTHRAETTD